MRKKYVVIGTTGEYSDRSEWLVKAFNTESEAKVYVVLCEAQGRLAELARNKGEIDTWGDIPERYLKYDKAMYIDYTGVSYYYEEVELEETENE